MAHSLRQKGISLMNISNFRKYGKGGLYFFCLLLPLFITGCSSTSERLLLAEALPSPAASPSPVLEEVNESEDQPKEGDDDSAKEEKPSLLYVDVAGSVVRPGVYALPEGSRVFTAIDAAGGFTANAATRFINQALPLSDGEQIYVPSWEETEETAAAPPSLSSSTSAPEEAKVNLNTAGIEELTSLNGIGPGKAQAILDYREEHGAFTSVEEVQQVGGIKGATYEKIKEHVEVK